MRPVVPFGSLRTSKSTGPNQLFSSLNRDERGPKLAPLISVQLIEYENAIQHVRRYSVSCVDGNPAGY